MALLLQRGANGLFMNLGWMPPWSSIDAQPLETPGAIPIMLLALDWFEC
jgi:hypothetical protein